MNQISGDQHKSNRMHVMHVLKGVCRRMGTVWTIGVVAVVGVLSMLGLLVWPSEKADAPAPMEYVALDKTPLNVSLLARDDFVAASYQIDPYEASPLRLRHRPPDAFAGSYQATFLAPPRLISAFSLRRDAGPDGPETGALHLAALLPDLKLRTPENHPPFEGDQNDRLDIVIAYIQTLGPVPDSWHRQFITCEKTSVPHVESDYPGLTVNATRTDIGYLQLMACEPGDVSPDGNPLLTVCRRDVYTREMTTCRVELVIPWTNFSEEIQRRRPRYQGSGSFKDYGIVAIYEFSARYLSRWGRVRDLTFCLIEAVVVEIDQIETISRKPETCEAIRSALNSGQAVLAPSSDGGS